LQASSGGGGDAFVAKLNVTGSALVYSAYLGGNGADSGQGIAVDSSGNAYVTGSTSSTNFPTVNPLQPSNGGGGDAFVAKLNATGSALVYSTYLGGNGGDSGQGVAVDSSANAYVIGSTSSTNFPTVNPLQAACRGDQDAFVAKLNATGSALLYSTYLGGDGWDYGAGIAVDSSGNAYVTGFTYSTNFPTVNPLQATYGGNSDAFVAKLNATGSALVYSSYLGGNGPGYGSYGSGGSRGDSGQGIAVDFSGNAYVTGYTSSTDFPMVNPLQAANRGGDENVFVAKLNAAGSALVYSTYLGGNGRDHATGISVDPSGNAYVAGFTNSANFPTVNPLQAAHRGSDEDTFVAKLNAAGSALVYSTYLGGNGHDFSEGVAVESSGKAYVTGYTSSTDFPMVNPLQASNGGGGGGAFVAKIDAGAAQCDYSITPTSAAPSTGGGTGSVAVAAPTGCGWTAFSGVGWITITSGDSGNGNGTVSYSVAPNNSSSARSGTVIIVRQTFTVNQAGVPCSYAVAPVSASAAASGGTGTVTMTAPSDCTWIAASNAGWITITSGDSGSGNGRVGYSVAANSSSSARSGTVTIAGQTFTVNQAGDPCGCAIAPVSASAAASGGTGTVTVTAPSGCTWTAASGASWITTTSGSSGSGNGTVNYSVAANTGTASRTGTLTIRGNTFTLTQDGPPCSYAISRSSDTLTASARDGFVGVTTTSGCAWTANSSVGWITITAGSGSGNGGVSYSVAENGSVNSRTGTLTIAGQIFTVTQAGAPCPYAISPASGSFSASGGTGSITVPAPTDCTWAARSNVSWIAITAGSSASGNGTVSYSVAAYTSSIVPRTGTVTIGGQTFTVTQAGAPCTYVIVPAKQSFLAIGGFGSVNVTAPTGCTWTAASNASWITITSGASGNGSGTVTYSVAPYTDAPTRGGLMLIGGQLFTVTQAGSAGSFPVVPAGGTVNGANFSSSVPGGSIGSLFGTNLALSRSFGSSLPLPTTLGGATVEIDGIPAPLFYVSPAQINFQMPWQLLGQSEASITVTVGGLTSAAQPINIAAFSPGLFSMNSQGTGQGAVLIGATSEIAAPLGSIAGRATRPVQRGEYLSIYCTGLGPVANQPANGAASSANPLSTTMNTPAVTIGGLTATVGFSGLAPGFVGLYQVNVQVPENAPTGNGVSVVLALGGAISNTVTVAVQ
jgi:uncharacterized protein (TIGR03437 family)